jgi:hypothetical protein
MQEISPTTQTRRRGRRIKQTAWPGILKLYQDGATLTAIARIYDCTPSAICYIVKKAERVYGDLTQFSKGEPISQSMSWAAQNPREPIEPAFDPWAEQMVKASKDCLRQYRQWRQNGGEIAHHGLANSVHEIRRILARLEIEMYGTARQSTKSISYQLDGGNI